MGHGSGGHGSGGRRSAAENAGQASLRASNLRLIVTLVYAADEPISRADLSVASGLTRSTVSRLTEDLLQAGFLRELGPARITGPGRPAVPLAPATGTLVATGAEIAPAHVAVRSVDLSGRVLAEHWHDTDLMGSDAEVVLGDLGVSLRTVHARLPDGVRPLGTALALPGLVEQGSGRLLQAPNLGWRDVVPARLVRGLGPGPRLGAGDVVHVGNEADLAATAVAQTRPGHPSALRDMIYLSGEVGIGAAVVREGAVLAGRHGWAGEVGHLTVDVSGPLCRCGSSGCLEQYAGRPAILRAAGLPEHTTPAELARLADTDHPGARQALHRAGGALGIALAGVINLLDVPTVVLGGDLGLLARHLIPAAEPELVRRVLSARWVPPRMVVAHPGSALTGDVPTGGATSRVPVALAPPVEAAELSLAATGAAYHLLGRALDRPDQQLPLP